MSKDEISRASAEALPWSEKHQVAHHLKSLFYLPDFVSEDEEQRLLRESRASKAKWVQLSGRRLQNHGGVVHAKGLIPAPLPSWLQPLLRRLADEEGPGGLYGGKPPNHVLVNSYFPGEGIMPHEDGPTYHPVVAILSLGAPAVLRFRRKPPPEAACGPDVGGTIGEAGEAGCAASSCTDPDAVNSLPATQSAPEPNASEAGGETAGASSGGGASGHTETSGGGVSDTGGEVAKVELAEERGDPGEPGGDGGVGLGADDGTSGMAAREIRCCTPQYTASVLLQPRSLVVFRDEAFTDCLHSIEEVSEEVLDESVANLDMYGLRTGAVLPRGAERISLTVRRVAKVMPAILRPRGM